MLFMDPKLFCECHELTTEDCHKLLNRILPQMSFQKDGTVLDIGCGTGDNTRDIIRAKIPKMKKLVAIDIQPEFIEFAKAHFSDEKIEYHVADIEDRSFLKPWEGSISTAFSVYCFNLLKDQRTAFQTLYDLLKPDGEAALLFFLSCRAYDSYPEMINSEKWNKYLKNVDQRIPESHRLRLGADHYRKLLKDLGYEVLLCEEEDRTYPYSDDKIFKGILRLFSPLPHYIPEKMRGEFVDEFFDCILKSSSRNSDGCYLFQYRVLTVHIRKH